MTAAGSTSSAAGEPMTRTIDEQHLTKPGHDGGNDRYHVAGTGSEAKNWMPARTCSRSEWFCTRWRPASSLRGDSTADIFDAILNRAPAPAVRLNPDLPPKLEDIINKALEKDQEPRVTRRRVCEPTCTIPC